MQDNESSFTQYIIYDQRLLRTSALKRSTPHSKAKIRLVRHCAAISATDELLLYFRICAVCVSFLCFCFVLYFCDFRFFVL